MIKQLIQNMYMNRQRANERIESLLDVHIAALRGDPRNARVVEALTNARQDFHGLIAEIFDELDAIVAQDETDRQAAIEAADDGA